MQCFNIVDNSLAGIVFRQLLEKYDVKVIPALRIIKVDGTVAVEDARSQVTDRGADEPLALFEEWQKASQ